MKQALIVVLLLGCHCKVDDADTKRQDLCIRMTASTGGLVQFQPLHDGSIDGTSSNLFEGCTGAFHGTNSQESWDNLARFFRPFGVTEIRCNGTPMWRSTGFVPSPSFLDHRSTPAPMLSPIQSIATPNRPVDNTW